MTQDKQQYIRDGNVICGKTVAEAVRREIAARVGELKERYGKVRPAPEIGPA